MKKSVLVIDDENDLCKLVSIVLNKDGFQVSCAHNLAEAKQKLHERPDIVLLDNNLPDGTGLDFLQTHPSNFTESYVIMISADPGKELQKKASDEGIQNFLSKPFSMVRMREILKAV